MRGRIYHVKRFLLVLFLLMTCAVPTIGQEMVEAVYLKNGSIIRGTVVELVPDESIKLQTTDGNIVVYPMDDIVKIIKESSEYTIRKGYVGFVDVGGGFGAGDAGGYVEVTTSHGCQIMPYLFIGAGTGVGYDFPNANVNIPVFADVRYYHILEGNILPFVGMKMGYSLIDLSYNGFYLNPSIGCRHALGDFALNVTFNYELQKEFSYGGYSYIGFKVGFEF